MIGRYLIEFLDENGAFRLQALHDIAVVDDLVADIDWCAVLLQRQHHDLDRAVHDIARVLPTIIPSAELIGRAVDLARRLFHPLYDCLFLALAERCDTVLVFADQEFVGRP